MGKAVKVSTNNVWLSNQALRKRIKKLLAFVKSRQILIAFLVSLVLLITGLITLYFSRPYTSDSVVIQTIFHQHLTLPGKGVAWLGEDNYLLKLPYYLFVGAVFQNSRHVLLATTIIFNVIGFGLFFYSCLYFLKRFKAYNPTSLLAIVWLFSLSSILGLWFLMNPNLRNIGIGINFVVLVGFAKYMDGDLRFTKPKGKVSVIILAILFGLFLYSDPFFVYMLAAPLLLFFLSLLYIGHKRQRAARMLSFVFVALVFMELAHKSATLFQVYNRHVETHFIMFSQLWTTLSTAISSYFLIFGADFWGKNAFSPGAIRNILNAILLLIIIFFPLYVLKTRKQRQHDPWLIFWVLQPIFITILFVFSTNSVLNGSGSLRFLALLPFYAPLIVALVNKELLKTRRSKNMLALLLVVAIVLNTGFMLKQIQSRPADRPNSENLFVINLLHDRGLTKGVGDYWNSHINTYLSNYTITFIPVNCLQIQHFLMDDKTLLIPAQKSFYFYDTQYPSQCDKSVIYQYLGVPASTITLSSTQQIFIYNYDITHKLTNGYFD